MTQDISKMAEEILQKHLQDKVDEFFTGYELKSILAAMQEYAALTSPASGWVKCSERAVVSTPGKKVIIKYKGVPDLLINHRGTLCWYEEERVCNYEYPVDNDSWSAIEWLDENIISAETPLPTVEEVILEIADAEPANTDGDDVYIITHDQLESLIQYAQKPVK